MKSLLYRPLQLAAGVFAMLLLVALTILGVLAWRNEQRIETIRVNITRTHAIQRTGLQMQRALDMDLQGARAVDRDSLARMTEELGALAGGSGYLLAATPGRLRDAGDRLREQTGLPRASLAAALERVQRAGYEETGASFELLDAIDTDSATELEFAVTALIVLPSMLVLALWLLRNRILNPINNLRELLSRLAGGEFTPIPLRHVDPLLLPLLDNYNSMVIRLHELEQARRSHTASLEAEVRAATRTLIQQHRSLAQSERLAAVGEVAAGVAHELRNPLASAHLALSNLRREVSDVGFAERLDLVIAELERITRLLNQMLAQARHIPESGRLVNLSQVVRDLVALVRHQAPVNVTLRTDMPEELVCRAPEAGLRQALLNLVLNAFQALEGREGSVTIEMRREERRVSLSVIDDGPGFAPAFLAGPIRPFVSGRESGTGLGLAMVRRFVHDAGGELRLGNRHPHGACVTLLLPCEV